MFQRTESGDMGYEILGDLNNPRWESADARVSAVPICGTRGHKTWRVCFEVFDAFMFAMEQVVVRHN